MSTSKPLIVILGPTASGKSELALNLAKKYNGEIINADSRQIYKEMAIGTGSPILESDNQILRSNKIKCFTVEKIPYYLFHFVNPKKQYSVAEYKRSAIKIIRDIHKRRKLPILVGGTGLYIRSIVDNLNIPKAPPDNKIRIALERKSPERLFAILNKVDPNSALIIGPCNKRKLIRALEVYKITGKPFSSQQIKGKPLFDVLQIGIKTDREELCRKIDRRIDKMIKSGLIKETQDLIRKYSCKLPAMTGIGYKEIGQYLSGELPLLEAVQRIKFRTHQYARRQMTWFKRDERINWIDGIKNAKSLVSSFIKQ